MSFKITITKIPNKELGPIIARLQLPRGVDYTATYGSDEVRSYKRKSKANGKGNPHSRADSRLTMTGKQAKEGSIIGQGIVLFERLEKRKGIGSVTVKDFREVLVKNEHPSAVSQRCITEGFLSYIDG
jgi:hypothetical protein